MNIPFKLFCRNGIQNFLVLLTNGGTSEIERTEDEAFRAKAEDVHIIVMAVG